MDSIPLHPQFVHLPLALATVTPVVALGILGAWWRGWFPRRTWLVVVALQAVLVAGGYSALQTGEIDEEQVEDVVAERYIEEHEEAAEAFEWMGAVVLGITLLVAFLPRERFALGTAGLATLGMLVVLWLGHRTGEAGGRLVYRHGAASAFISPAAGSGHGTVEEAERGEERRGHEGKRREDDERHDDDEDDDDERRHD